MRYALAAAMLMAGAVEEPVVWVFFSPDSPDASPLFAQLRGVRVRPVLLTERYLGRGEPSVPFLATLRAAGEVRVVDEEGLREAVRLGIRELPAVAVTRGRRTHVACGDKVDVKEFLRCAK